MWLRASKNSWHFSDSKGLPFLELFLHTLLIILLLYFIRQPFSLPYIKPAFACIIMAAWFYFPRPLYHPFFWTVLLAYFTLFLVKNYYFAANHHFVAWYLLIAILYYMVNPRHNEEVLKYHARFILMFVLVTSALHKLLSPAYTSGSFFQFEMYTDIFLKPLKWVIPGWETAVRENLAAFKQLKSQYPGLHQSILMKEPMGHAALFAKMASRMAILMEALAGIAMFFRSHHRISHCLLLATVCGVILFRLEAGFLAILSCIGLLLSPGRSWRNLWLFCFILFAALVATSIGLR